MTENYQNCCCKTALHSVGASDHQVIRASGRIRSQISASHCTRWQVPPLFPWLRHWFSWVDHPSRCAAAWIAVTDNVSIISLRHRACRPSTGARRTPASYQHRTISSYRSKQ